MLEGAFVPTWMLLPSSVLLFLACLLLLFIHVLLRLFCILLVEILEFPTLLAPLIPIPRILWFLTFEILPIVRLLRLIPRIIHGFLCSIFGLTPLGWCVKITELLFEFLCRFRRIKVFEVLLELASSPFVILSLVFRLLFPLLFPLGIFVLNLWVRSPFSHFVIPFPFRFIIENLISVRDFLELLESMLATTLVRMVELSQSEECILYLRLRGGFSNF